MSTALAVIESITAIEFFKPGASTSIIDKVIAESLQVAASYDVSTPAGEAGLRSLAAKLGKVKNRLEEQGVALVADKKAEIKLVDTERKVVWERLEAAQKEIKKPVLEKEQQEKDRIAAHEARIAAIAQSGADTVQNWQTLSLEVMEERFAALQTVDHDWQEFAARAQQAGYQAFVEIRDAIARRKQYDQDQKDLVELRAAQAKRDQEEREARIAQEAREAAEAVARKLADEQRLAAEAERQRVEDERIQAEARAKQAEAKAAQDRMEAAAALEAEQARARQAEAQRVEAEERAAREAEEAVQRQAAAVQAERERAERERQAAELRAEAARQAAEEKAEADRLAAIEAERQRAAEVQRKEQEATAAREANRKHTAKINGEVRDALMKACTLLSSDLFTVEVAQEITAAIAKGLIPHTKINY